MPLSRRRFNLYLLGALGASALSPAMADLIEGRDWRPISPPQPSDTPGKIEVLEFFSYGCPHCSDFNPVVTPWAERLPEDVTFRRIPVTFGRTAWANLARLYYTLEAMGDLERLDQAVFDALHKQRVRLYTKPAIIEWLDGKDVDTQRFAEIFDSFDVQAKIGRSDYLVQRYQITGVPTLTVAGRYAVLGRAAKGFEGLLGIADALIDKARTEGAAA